uniref:hypothetical protein n=1 Tax=Candidatus Fimivicinus sp. TaxID=3056640 RepID=UPI003FEF1D36
RLPCRKARRITLAEALGIALKTVVAPVHRCYHTINAPIIFTLASYDTVNWPYKTDGHYTNLVGYSNPNRDNPNQYLNSYYIVDPYYFPKYGHGNYADGKFTRSFAQLWKVNTNKMGAGQNAIGY